MTARQLDWILVHSQKGGTVRLTSPFLTETEEVFCEDRRVEVRFEDQLHIPERHKRILINSNRAKNPEVPDTGNLRISRLLTVGQIFCQVVFCILYHLIKELSCFCI